VAVPTKNSPRLFVAALVVVPASVALVCALFYHLGSSRHHDVSWYFSQITDSGHPGAGMVFASLGFAAGASLAGLLAVLHPAPPRVRNGWVALTLLMAVLAVDGIFRAHQWFPHGDVLSRILYSTVAAAAIVAVLPAVRRSPGWWMGIAGVTFAAISEVLDHWTERVPDGSGRYQTLTALEESAAALGAWCAVIALVGMAIDANHTASADGLSRAQPAGAPPR
jgi:hypothetical protein